MTKGITAFHVLIQAIKEREPDPDYIPIFADAPNILLNISDAEFDRLAEKKEELEL